MQHCEGLQLAPAGKPPFTPGEELSYELSFSGLYVGRMEIKVGRPRMVNGDQALTFFARARTSGFTSAIKSFAGRYMVLSDADDFRPIVLRSESKYGEDPRTEHAKFTAAKKVSAEYLQQGKSGVRAYDREKPVFDILTLLYYARMIPLERGTKLCQEVYADKRLWRMEAEIAGVQDVPTPAGNKKATLIKTKWVRIPHPDFDPRRKAPSVEVDIFFAADDTKLPLRFIARAKEGTALGELTRWSTKDGDGELSWDF